VAATREGQLVRAWGVEGSGSRRTLRRARLNARAGAALQLALTKWRLRRRRRPERSRILDEVGVAIDVAGDLLGDGALKRMPVRGRLDQRKRGGAGLVGTCWREPEVSELLDRKSLGMAARGCRFWHERWAGRDSITGWELSSGLDERSEQRPRAYWRRAAADRASCAARHRGGTLRCAWQRGADVDQACRRSSR